MSACWPRSMTRSRDGNLGTFLRPSRIWRLWVQRSRLLAAARHRERVGEPEAARQERPLAGRQPVVGLVGRVAQHEALVVELAPDGLDRADHARVITRQETDARDQQQRGVERLGAVGLRERAALGVPALLAHLAVDLLALAAPAVGVA